MVGFGGINSAGRLSFNHAYRRLVIDKLDQVKQARTYQSLAQIMGLADSHGEQADTRDYIRYSQRQSAFGGGGSWPPVIKALLGINIAKSDRVTTFVFCVSGMWTDK